jgi:hypothetical protein
LPADGGKTADLRELYQTAEGKLGRRAPELREVVPHVRKEIADLVFHEYEHEDDCDRDDHDDQGVLDHSLTLIVVPEDAQ